jgi:hypothetical protein
MAKQPQRQTLETVRSGALQEQTLWQKPPQKRGRGFRVTAGRYDRHFCESLRPRNPSLSYYPGNGITIFTKGGAVLAAD